MAAAEPTVTARLVAAWPALAFAVAFELLLQQRRVVAAPVPAGEDSPAAGPVVAEPDGAGGPVVDAPPGDRVHRAAVGDGSPGAHPAEPTDPADELDDLTTRARQLLATSSGRPPGRRALARELGITEHRARTVLDLVGATGPSSGADAPDGGDLR